MGEERAVGYVGKKHTGESSFLELDFQGPVFWTVGARTLRCFLLTPTCVC